MHRLLISHDSSTFLSPLPRLLAVRLSLDRFSTGISPLKRYSSAANTLIPLKRLSKIYWFNPMSKRLHYLAELWQHHFFPVFGSGVRILQESNYFQNDFELRSNRYFLEGLLPVTNLILMIWYHQKIITEE